MTRPLDAFALARLLEDARAERDDLAKTLLFYADRRNYRPPAGGDSYDAMVARDSYDGNGPGARARASLSNYPVSGAGDET